MRRAVLVGTALSLILIGGRALWAQAPGVGPGSKVRVTAPTVFPKPHVGVVRHIRGDTIVFRSGRGVLPVWIRVAPITRMDLAIPVPRSRWKKTAPLWAMGLGMGAGAIVGTVTTPKDDFLGPEFGAVVVGGLGGIAGLVTGFVIGRKTERWQQVPEDAFPRRTSTSPGIFIVPGERAVGLGFRAAF